VAPPVGYSLGLTKILTLPARRRWPAYFSGVSSFPPTNARKPWVVVAIIPAEAVRKAAFDRRSSHTPWSSE
jgi:hypothetical protein